MNPGISIRFGNNATHKKARRTSEDNGRHFSYFGKIQNNLGGSHLRCHRCSSLRRNSLILGSVHTREQAAKRRRFEQILTAHLYSLCIVVAKSRSARELHSDNPSHCWRSHRHSF